MQHHRGQIFSLEDAEKRTRAIETMTFRGSF
jgi:hypothetical protein